MISSIVRISLGRVLLVVCLGLSSSLALARGFGGVGGGDFHQGMNQGYHQDNVYHDDGYVGNYHPGNGYGGDDAVIINAGDGGSNCQTEQQCDSDGNCNTIQNCD